MLSDEYLSTNIDQYINSKTNTTCRLCLKQFNFTEFQDIFNSFENTTIAEYITNFAKIPITKEDCFSKVICKQCVKHLNGIEGFRKFICGCHERLKHLNSVYYSLIEQSVTNNVISSIEAVIKRERDEEILVKIEESHEPTEEDTKIDIISHSLIEIVPKVEPDVKLDSANCNMVTEKVKPKKFVRRKNPALKFACSICDKVYKNRGSRDIHYKTHSKREYYKCEVCNKEFLSKYFFNSHKEVHINGKGLECKICGKQFVGKHTLKTHMETHAEVPNYQCDECGKRFSHPHTLRGHRISHTLKLTEVKCEVCNKTIRSRYSQALKHHMKQQHSNTNEKLCPKCGKSFKTKYGFTVHLKNHNGELEFKCEQCPKCYSSKKSLQNHVQSVHSTVKPFSCEICGKTFALKSYWYIHGKVHAKENPFTCTICQKKFGYCKHLKGHMKAVHGIVEDENEEDIK